MTNAYALKAGSVPAPNSDQSPLFEDVWDPGLYRVLRLISRPLTSTLLFVMFWFAGSSTYATAQTFQGIQRLAFTKTYQGANPLPQEITFASTGNSFQFSVKTVSSTGGNWLTLNVGTGCCLNTPAAVTVSVNPDTTLASGTYSAQIIATSSDNAHSVAIPVSLIIEQPSAVYFDDLPGALTFSMLTKGTPPPQQSIPIRNAGSGTLAFTASATTSDGGKWITLSAASGTAPFQLAAGINPDDLPGQGLVAGSFVGQVKLVSGSDTVTIPVTATVGDSVFRQANALSFAKSYQGANPLPQQLTVASTGAAFQFSVKSANSTGGNWLALSVGTGCCLTTPTTVTVSVNPDITLAAGTYSAQIIATSSDLTQSQVIPVTLDVEPPTASYFDDLPGQLTFSMMTKGMNPPAEVVQIRNAGSGSLTFNASASTADGGNWITLSAASGNAPSQLSVGIIPGNLPGQALTPGTFTGQVLLKTGSGNVTIPVTVTVGDSVFGQVNPLSFTKPYEGSNPLPQVITFDSTGASFQFTVRSANSTGGNWLSLSAGSGCCLNTPSAVTVSVNPDITLAAGTYAAQIIATSSDLSQTQVIPVTLNIQQPNSAFFDSLPGQLTYSMVTKGLAPPQQTIQIRNAGVGTLAFTASASTADGANWIALSAASGNAPYLLSVSIASSKLPGGGLSPGTFTGQVLLRSGNDTVTIPVTITVGDSVFRQINPLNFTKGLQGANPLAQEVTFASTGDSFQFTVKALNSTGGNWLSVNVGTGCCLNTPEALTVSVNPDINLAAGTYSAQIIATSSDATQSEVIPVTLTVQPAKTAFFEGLPGALTFSGLANGTALPSLPLPIRNGGPGALNWVATPITSDRGSWLNISVNNGTAPATPMVTISPAALPGKGLVAGTFTAQIMLQSASGIVTVPVTVTLGATVFNQVSPLSFTKGYQGSNPASQTVKITSTGNSIQFTTRSVSSTGGDWLSVSVGQGCCSSTAYALTVAANPDVNLAPGVYTASIYVVTSDSREPLVIPVSLTVTSSTPTAAPAFTPTPGTYSTVQTVTLSSTTNDAAIYYTTDGTTPTTSSARYSSPLRVSATETLRAFAIAPAYTQSAVSTGQYTIVSSTAATPAVTQTITITEATAGVSVYYTTDGSTPTASSTKYTGPLTLSSTSVLKFIAIGPNYAPSSVKTVTTTIQ